MPAIPRAGESCAAAPMACYTPVSHIYKFGKDSCAASSPIA